MLRVLHVVPSYYPAVRYGGPIRSVHGLAAAQVKLGHCVYVFTTNVDGPGISDVPTDKPIFMDGVEIHYFPVPFLKRLYWSPAMTASLQEMMNTIDIVHLHSVFLWPTYAAARAASDAGVPYLLAPRGSLVRSLINAKSRWLKRAWISLVEKRNIRRAAGLHVTSDVEERDVYDLKLPISRVYCIPNGINVPTEIAPLEQSGFNNLCLPYVLFVGRLNWKKGLERLIESWPLVAEPLTLVLAGNDEDGYQKKLDQLVTDLGISRRVKFLGQVSDEHKWPLYKHAAAFVLPSFSENFGNVVIEAMMMACPVVVSPGVGVAELVRRERCGIVTDNNPEQLAKTIAQIIDDPKSARAMGERGRAIALDSLTWSSVAKQMNQAYEDSISRCGRNIAKA